jgi:hypothetical protein
VSHKKLNQRRLWILAVAGLLAVGLAWDLSRQPQHQWTAKLLIAAIETYQQGVSGALGRAGVQCRFEPSCSHYAVAAIRKHGAALGSWRAVHRLSRCGPWTPAGTSDPP